MLHAAQRQSSLMPDIHQLVIVVEALLENRDEFLLYALTQRPVTGSAPEHLAGHPPGLPLGGFACHGRQLLDIPVFESILDQ
jgi:hypothetical protein